MSIAYETKRCEYCQKTTAWEPTIGQIVLFSFLLCLCILPGLIYYYCKSPKCCKSCGFTYYDGMDQCVKQDKLDKNTTDKLS